MQHSHAKTFDIDTNQFPCKSFPYFQNNWHLLFTFDSRNSRVRAARRKQDILQLPTSHRVWQLQIEINFSVEFQQRRLLSFPKSFSCRIIKGGNKNVDFFSVGVFMFTIPLNRYLVVSMVFLSCLLLFLYVHFSAHTTTSLAQHLRTNDFS